MKIDCIYPLSKREINKEEFQQMKKQNEKYKFLLLKVSERGGCIVDDINQALEVCYRI